MTKISREVNEARPSWPQLAGVTEEGCRVAWVPSPPDAFLGDPIDGDFVPIGALFDPVDGLPASEPGVLWVYRFYDVHKRLLYVGQTQNPRLRFRAHRNDKAWWREVVAAFLDQFPVDTGRILEIERWLIATCRPIYNRKDNERNFLPVSVSQHGSDWRFEQNSWRWSPEVRAWFDSLPPSAPGEPF